jgi:hypothetical protein
MTGHCLMVLMPYDGKKNLDAIQFDHIPIWIWVFKLPMGLMNRSIAEIVGNEVGFYLDADVDESGSAVGCFLRIKVHIDIRKH